MYNEERKTLWMQSMAGGEAAKQARSFLDRLDEAVEGPLGVDLFELIESGRRQDVISALEKNGRFFSYLILRRFCTYANTYLAWCYATMRSMLAPSSEKLIAYDVSLIPAFTQYFIRTQDELESALVDAPLRDGFLLPVCCSLAWMGYSVKDMCALSDDEVTVSNGTAFVRGEAAPEGFVNDTLRIWAKTDVFFRGVRSVPYVKATGDKFVRQTFPEGGVYTQLKDTVSGVRSLAARCVTRKTGESISYRQLSAAGEFQKLRALEAAGSPIDTETVSLICGVKGQMASDRLNEYRQFCASLLH